MKTSYCVSIQLDYSIQLKSLITQELLLNRSTFLLLISYIYLYRKLARASSTYNLSSNHLVKV